MSYKITAESWSRLLTEAADFESPDSNFKFDFKKLTKAYGLTYIVYLGAAYTAYKDGNCGTDEQFCQLNGNVPLAFLNSKIKKDLDSHRSNK